MNNFKIGDVVERLDDDFLSLVGPGPHVVTGVGTYGWLQINDWCDRSGNTHPWSPQYFTLVDGGDDELPPAPESVRYNEGTDAYPLEVKSLEANPYYPRRIRIGILCGTSDVSHKYHAVDPDTALQLAHDLTRMAMEIKRKEKQNG
ncbi:MAG: hypothetical protein [Caudoviricetes sp.]|nr:MAG: hypothetical protein [Caudoviricetes sp.]